MKGVFKDAVAVTLPVLILLAAGCTGGQWEAEEQVTSQGVEMNLKLGDVILAPGETLQVHAEVTNVSGEEMEYTMWNMGDPAIYTRIHTPYEASHVLRAPEDPEVVQPAVTFGSLGSGETIQREVSWVLDENQPNGTYTAEAVFFPGRQVDDPQFEPVVLTHDVQVQGSFDIIPAQQVYAEASENPSVQLWLNGHTGEAVAREQKGSYTVNMGGEWQQANEELYQEALNAAEPPALSLDLESRQFQVTYSSKFGFAPSEISLGMDAETGEVASVSPDLRAELDGGVVATFQVGNSSFRVFVTNEDAIEQLYSLQRGEISASIPNSPLHRGPGAGMHNAPWSWHLDPEQLELADFTIEVCDGTPEFVEEELEYWLEQVGQYCPWSAELVEIEDYRE